MKSLIEQLYYGRISPYTDPPRRCGQAEAAREKYEQAYDAFSNKLEPELRREFQRLIQAHTEETNFGMAASFAQGYRLGARMMMDMLAKE